MDPEISVEARLEAALAKQYGETPADDDLPVSPDAGEEVATEPEPPQGESSEESAAEAQASEQDQPQDDGEEVEYEGATYKVPKELKDALLRQSDYTRKTQDVAKQRKAYEELQQTLVQEQQFHNAAFSVAAEARALEMQLKRFEGVDWAQLARDNPSEALTLDQAYRALERQHAAKTQEAQQAWYQAQTEAAKRREVQAAKAHEELSREIQGWGPELQTRLAESGKTYGFSDQELGSLIDPRMVKVLHDAHQWRALQSAKPAVTKKVQTAKPVTAPSARTAQTSAQNAAYASARAALKKTGTTAAAERALEMRFAKRMK